ncbi:MAG TPA: AAA family ATPase, partial [Gammaproteobacteria bacterium]|nr:AAA family ATPase [Gammaproteobacteria bacterium]
MKIRKLSLPAFGAFTEREIDFPDGPAVVVGPNEAGKTTLFTALTTLLYGFRPANERDFPYVPRAGGRRAELAADVVLGDGAEARASRRLLSSPVGEWQQGDGRENVGNHPLPPAAHVDHDLYRALYALTIDDMRVVEGQAFTQVEQRLLGELGNPWQRPARTVAAELDAAAKQQWRPNRKGKSRHRELKSQRNDLNTEFKSAKAHQ